MVFPGALKSAHVRQVGKSGLVGGKQAGRALRISGVAMGGSLVSTGGTVALPSLPKGVVTRAWPCFLSAPLHASLSPHCQVLVDLGSKNAKGLYQARVRATVGHRSTAFTGLIGLTNDSLYRSMPGLIARALESLKT